MINFLTLKFCFFLEFHITGSIQYIVICIGFLLFSIMILKSIHIVACINNSFLFVAEWNSRVWMYHILFTHLLAGGHLTCFQILAIMNKATIKIQVQVFLWICFNFFYKYLEVGCYVFIWLWYQCNAAFINEFLSVSSYFLSLCRIGIISSLNVWYNFGPSFLCWKIF